MQRQIDKKPQLSFHPSPRSSIHKIPKFHKTRVHLTLNNSHHKSKFVVVPVIHELLIPEV